MFISKEMKVTRNKTKVEEWRILIDEIIFVCPKDIFD